MVLEVYNPYSIVQLSEVLQEFTIRRGEQSIYHGRAVVNNLVNTGLMLIVSVALLDPWSDLIGTSSSTVLLRQEAESFISDWSSSNKIRSGYQLAVSEIQSLFSDLSRWLEQLDLASDDPDLPQKNRLSNDLFFALLEPIASEAQRLLHQFEKEASDVSNEEVPQHKAYAQKCVHPLIMRAPFPFRAFSKPLGYAGDYEMVNMMVRDPREGPSTYAELINTLYLSTAPAQAHRNRIELLLDLLVEAAELAKRNNKQLRVLNIGCGPALELQQFFELQEIPTDAYFNLVDFSRETLDYTEQRLKNAFATADAQPEIQFTHMSVHSLLKQASPNAQPSHVEPYGLIYCAGLFDYLSDRVCSRLLRLFHHWADSQTGVIVATNVHPNNSALYLMEHILEWFLVYRDEEAMSALANGLDPKVVYSDDTGVNVFLKIRRRG